MGEGAPEGRSGVGPLWGGLRVQVLDGPDRSSCFYELLASDALWWGRLQYIVYPNSLADCIADLILHDLSALLIEGGYYEVLRFCLHSQLSS